jgi:hypothetical protein
MQTTPEQEAQVAQLQERMRVRSRGGNVFLTGVVDEMVEIWKEARALGVARVHAPSRLGISVDTYNRLQKLAESPTLLVRSVIVCIAWLLALRAFG